jgi:two-component system alkaline phosphatase synthesis response regulator PhoP
VSSKTRILVVEDERDIAELIVYNLKREGFRVDTATSGEEGLSKAREDIPDIVVLDIMLPGIDGLEVSKTLRHDFRTEQIAIDLEAGRVALSDQNHKKLICS